MTRSQKIKVLQAIQNRQGTIETLMGFVVEFWQGTDKEPGKFTNEATGHRLTASQLKKRQQARPWVIFVSKKMLPMTANDFIKLDEGEQATAI